MCGIVGVISRRRPSEIEAAVRRANHALAHRGPDDEGIETLASDPDGWTVIFGHRRLAILDLSAAGHQPMQNRMTGDWVTYNGEVFNFREIRTQLEAQGNAFYTGSDTEVVLTGLGSRGVRAVNAWRGMFALGWWKESEGKLVLVRDRLGIKPLYYYFDGETFIFASELRALLASGLVPHDLSRTALESYLAYGSVEQPLTMLQGVYSVLPGHTLTFRDGEIASESYWEISSPPVEDSQSEGELNEEIAHLLAESVRLRLVSDVPVGAFLSGGIDSSSVVSLLRRATSGDIDSFSVCFREEEFSEREYAEQVARKFGTRHHTVMLTGDEVLASLGPALGAMDQPSVDGINSWVVSKAAADAGLKVAVSGLGGDEVFAGYGFFRTITRDDLIRRQAQRLPPGLRMTAAVAVGAVSSGNRATKLKSLLRGNDLDEPTVRLHRRLFTSEQCAGLLVPSEFSTHDRNDEARLRRWSGRQLLNCSGTDPINQASALELGGYMANTLLRDTDTMSMAHSLEVRVPLIDHVLVERMLRVPGEVKLRQGRPKWLLVDAVGDLPDEIVNRPKRGFELPFKHWLMGPLREQVQSSLNESKLDDVFQPGALRSVWEEFAAERLSWSRVWSLFALDQWCRANL
ncbi:MAG: asparagine synthase (glutamine-hydrolyzing) [Acidobacteriota bacterium]